MIGQVRCLALGEALFLVVALAKGRGAGSSYQVLTLSDDWGSRNDFGMHAGETHVRSWQWLVANTLPLELAP